MVISPLVIGGWLGARIVHNEQLLVDHRTQVLVLGQLRAVADDVSDVLRRYGEAVVAAEQGDGKEPSRSPSVRQRFRLSADGTMLSPDLQDPGSLTDAEREALERTRTVWTSGALRPARPETGVRRGPAREARAVHWHSWYWGDGLQWILWYETPSGEIHALELDRARLLAEVVGSLPDTSPDGDDLGGRVRLRDAGGQLLYQWGAYEPAEDSAPVATLALAPPVAAWTLAFHAPPGTLGAAAAGGLILNLVAGVALLGVAMLAAGAWLYREHSRNLREAAQRVSFVNQVSHELKTPLTNIRMYAEMLEERAPEDDEDLRRYAEVVGQESRRLSRLIGNVLTFGRQQRDAVEIHRRPGIVDEIVGACLDHHAPTLDRKGIAVERGLSASELVSFDPDVLEQILGNLIGNVEKYASGGKTLSVRTEQRGSHLEVTVSDAGPGIPSRERERVFQPFYRTERGRTESVAGTGIGLSIARDLARRHGGDLVSVPVETGACFRLTLECPPVTGDDS